MPVDLASSAATLYSQYLQLVSLTSRVDVERVECQSFGISIACSLDVTFLWIWPGILAVLRSL